MKWKLVVGSLFILATGFLIYLYSFFYQFEHKYDHLPQVKSVPLSKIANQRIPTYSGPHPAQLFRPHDPVKFPIELGQVGPVKSLFSGALQYPFLCNTEESGLGQPIVDNYQGIGIPVYDESVQNSDSHSNGIIGYSKDCMISTRAQYFYHNKKDGRFYPYEEGVVGITRINVNDRDVPFIVRVESGTINRFIYTIAVIKGENEIIDFPNGSNWNKKIIYQFRGGVGVGYRQGVNKAKSLLSRREDQLKQGYAILYSTANQTSNHYNIWLSEDTALRVKRQFYSLYGEEEYMVGLGGSGGAIQQYLIGQNNPGFMDAAIALYSYPDMVTQTTYALDCELMEYYFDIIDHQNSRWKHWSNRQLVEGLNSKTGVVNQLSRLYDFALLLNGHMPPTPAGMSECTKSWRGVTQLVNNPKYVHFYQRFSEQVLQQTHWSHWQDLEQFYGADENGLAHQTYDNVGVQYGLSSLISGKISLKEFKKLNKNIGGWKKPNEMKPERYWKVGGNSTLSKFSVWSHHNMTNERLPVGTTAKRTEGDISAMNAAYRSGHVFLGRLDIPVIDIRHYLEDELDMHHASASFSTRLRMIKNQGHAKNQIIWMAQKPYNPINQALHVIDKWLVNLNKIGSLVQQDAIELSRPQVAIDRCFSSRGEIISEGNTVWDGEWNKSITGDCMKQFPIYSESRNVAGAPLSGDVFKCQLQTIESAIQSGVYDALNMSSHLQELKDIFPQGVCDYSKPDVGLPNDFRITHSNFPLLPKRPFTEAKLGQ